MASYVYKDYHIELLTLFEFAEDYLKSQKMSENAGKELYEIFKRVVISSEIKPFITLSDDEKIQREYNGYLKRIAFVYAPLMPDLFEKDGALYDLMTVLHISKEYSDFNDFTKLFLLKISEIESNGDLSVKEFLEFQLYDNFFGNHEEFDGFCQQMTANDGFLQLLPESINWLVNWCDNYGNVTEKKSIEKKETVKGITIIKEQDIVGTDDNATNKSSIEITATNDYENNTTIEKNDVTKSFVLTESFEIKGRFTIEQIQHFFSFLHEENNRARKPYLSKEAVEAIFKDGLIIPVHPIEPRFKLNVDTLSPRKIIDCAFHEFFTKNSLTLRDKADYFRFFGSYIEDYKKALGTVSERQNFLSNINGEKSRKKKINLIDYLPNL